MIKNSIADINSWLDTATVVILTSAVLFIGLHIGVRVTLSTINEQAQLRHQAEYLNITPVTLRMIQDVPLDYIFHKETKFYQDNLRIIKKRNPNVPDNQTHMILKSVKSAADKYHIAEEVILGLIDIESTFNHQALSHCLAYGLMQINWSVWAKILREKGIANQKVELTVPSINIEAGTFILAHYVKEAKRSGYTTPNQVLRYAITRYNGGYINKHYNRLYSVMKLHADMRKEG